MPTGQFHSGKKETISFRKQLATKYISQTINKLSKHHWGTMPVFYLKISTNEILIESKNNSKAVQVNAQVLWDAK